MNELEKSIRGHLFDIKEIIDDIFALEEYFGFTHSDLTDIAGELKNSVEGGVLEYKKRILSAVFSFLETLKYDSRGFEKLSEFTPPLTSLVYIVLTQRLAAKGIVKGFEDKPVQTEQLPIEEKDLSIRDILADIQHRRQSDPQAENDPRIKSILAQVKQYGAELEKKRSFEPNIPTEKKASFEGNYEKIFNEFFRKIRETYYAMLKSEETKPVNEDYRKRLTDYDLSAFITVYQQQIEQYSALRSTILYAVKERYNIRETVVGLERKKDNSFDLLKREEENIRLVAPFEGDVKRFVRLSTTTLLHVLERHISLLKAGL